jgi:predicted PurR-regulated permease PerM
MTRLMMVLFSMIGTALAGSGVVVALTTGYDTLQPILIAAALGALLAVPATWWVARQIA